MTDDRLEEDQLRDLAARTARLPREIEPPADAWAAIRAAMDAPGHGATPRIWPRPSFLAAAALLLVAGSSAITAIAIDRAAARHGRDSASSGAPVASVRPAAGTPATLAEFSIRENDYISSANRLSAMLESEQMQLSPRTIAKLKESLRVIDAAILEARRALAEDPGNRQLIEMLSTSYSQKLDLLRRTTEMGRS